MKTLYQVILGLLAISNFARGGFQQDAVAAHNKLREKHHVPNLVYNSALDKTAQATANEWAASPHPVVYNRRNGNYGENLFSVNSSKYTDAEAVDIAIKFWYQGQASYDYNHPEKAKDRAAQFTQLVWKNSKNIGIGVARSSKSTYVCADYDPPGNYRESFPENVLKP